MLSDAAKKIEIGKTYQHFKGNLYKILYVAKTSEALEEVVVYEALYKNPEGQIWTRSVKMFQETVEANGAKAPRFKMID